MFCVDNLGLFFDEIHLEDLEMLDSMQTENENKNKNKTDDRMPRVSQEQFR